MARRAPDGHVRLRPLEEADIDDRYLAWFADPEVTRFLEARNITRDDALEHLRAGRSSGRWHMYAICRSTDGRHIGNLKIGPIHARHLVSDLVTVIGERDAWGKGFARAAISLGIDIAFAEHGIRKLSASIDSMNVGSLRAYTAAGFEVEAVLKDQFFEPVDGAPVPSDKVFVACFNPSFASASKAAQ
jgi:RimJ/RimL family protein N-acetyltransferase